MAGTEVTQQPTVPLRLADQIQSTGDKYADEEVVPEDAVTKDVEEKLDASTAQYTHHQSGTSR